MKRDVGFNRINQPAQGVAKARIMRNLSRANGEGRCEAGFIVYSDRDIQAFSNKRSDAAVTTVLAAVKN